MPDFIEGIDKAAIGLDMLNYRVGFFRAWIVFSICWVGYFSWEAYDANESIKSWHSLGQSWSKSLNEAASQGEKAPTIHPGGLDRAYYKAQVEYLLKQADESWTNRDIAQERFDTAIKYGPLVPIFLFASYFVLGFIAKGFVATSSRPKNVGHGNQESEIFKISTPAAVNAIRQQTYSVCC
ncbi:hypothetical protein LP416_21310 [Polaromonas sp. P2-4]|nr:hypothetical protein LP416_21310 [Polaromonas sp. P2-4]